MSRGRLIFWLVFLLTAAAAGRHFWIKNEPHRTSPLFAPQWTSYNIERMRHPNPLVAAAAWRELHHMYFTKWDAVDVIMASIHDDAPISFLVTKQIFPEGSEGAKDAFWAQDKAIYYKTERIHCRTVGEALLAIVYKEKRWRTEYQGNWTEWWEANKAYHKKA